MTEIYSDTHPEISKIQRNLLRQVGSARKLAMLGEMNKTVKINEILFDSIHAEFSLYNVLG